MSKLALTLAAVLLFMVTTPAQSEPAQRPTTTTQTTTQPGASASQTPEEQYQSCLLEKSQKGGRTGPGTEARCRGKTGY